jgi:hypothetical protein
MAVVCWKNRRFAQGTQAFAVTIALLLAATVTLTVVPTYALYNQTMLLPAVLLIVQQWHSIWARHHVNRVLLSLVALLMVWPWPVSLVLAVLSYLLPPARLDSVWALPYVFILPVPLGVTALVLMRSYQSAFAPPSEADTA